MLERVLGVGTTSISGLRRLASSSESDARPDMISKGREDDSMRLAGSKEWRSSGCACGPSSLPMPVDVVVDTRPFVSSLGEYDEANLEDVLGL